MKITVARLRKEHACNHQFRLFKKTFGNGGMVTFKKLVKAEEVGLSVFWAARRFMTTTQYHKFLDVRDRVDLKRHQWLQRHNSDNFVTSMENYAEAGRRYKKGIALAFLLALTKK